MARCASIEAVISSLRGYVLSLRVRKQGTNTHQDNNKIVVIWGGWKRRDEIG
jgi:hypothetical protein